MSDKSMQKSLSDIVNEVARNAKVLADVQSDNKISLELLNTIYQRVEDMSRKFDEVLNSGIKKPKLNPIKKDAVTTVEEEEEKEKDTDPKKKKKAASKKEPADANADSCKMIKNIMSYFKIKYIENQNYFNNILEEKQADALFAQHAEELNDKKGVNKIKTQASLLYKNLNKNQKNKIREKMMCENEAASVNNDDDIEEEVNSD